MNAKSIKGTSPEEIRNALQESTADGFSPTLAIVFLSVSQPREAIRRLFTEANITVFGITTNGEFIDEETEKGSVAVLLLDLNKDYFRIYFEDFDGNNYRETAGKLARQSTGVFPKVGFLLGISGAATDGEEVLQGLQEVAGNEINAFGGAAGDDYKFKQTFVFSNDFDHDQGIVLLAIDETKVRIKGIATCGWKAVGTEKIVTKSEGNHVYTIDDIPALDITAKYGGIENPNPDNEDLMTELASNFPLQLQRDKGDPVMRPGLVVDWNDRSFFTSGSVPQGSKVRFSLPPDWDVMEKVINGVRELKESEMPEADAIVVFSCAGRILSFGPMMNAEIEGIKQVWGVPMAGMFSNAELGRMAGGNLEMHNLTTCTIALKEL
ncbi:MAG: FIST N-terminal domain-containing protein [Robiginitalea sp.]